jgi:succinyl-diaminopimelate desuccinylase
MEDDRRDAEEAVRGYEGEMTRTLLKMIPIRAISPESGGEGESKRADFLEKILRGWGLKPKRYEYKDKSGVKRPNLVVKYGNKKRTLWVMAHIDTVSEGDRSLWKTDPFEGILKDGRVYGRGSQDNGQGVVASMYALKALLGGRLKYNFGLVLAADEELGSSYGCRKLVKEGIFRKGDMFLVPDAGNPLGDAIEIAEKGRLVLKVTVIGKQAHAASPDDGINALREAARYMLEADAYLHGKYPKKTRLFPRLGSTFEMTKHEKNVDSINIIPGREVYYMDCRVIPEYDLTGIVNELRRLGKKCAARIRIDVENREAAAPAERPDSEVVLLLSKEIRKVLHRKARLVGIGGGTMAAIVRRAGFDAAVWTIEQNTAHQPNEYVPVEDFVNTARVLVRLFLD